ncbi:hypothetical protein GE118_00435 [Mycoplasma sp. NEAQ87857]|uniref:MAGa7180 family putative nuclease n=1 Tax=Mycoplasma sp. NEAQ87857 TaxID=2683967 RepID=UPI001316531C|nr:YqaJ viral recombinase family protein [Mycoplasma sp. NEAQ87857]QGZ97271.1 hypothetical protein GE118_00435 [Mycoplasma sp. NEAQ87857]
MKRKYFNNRDYIVDLNNNVIILLEPLLKDLQSDNLFLKYKKIGGSTIGNILFPNDPYKSQFAAFCHIARLKLPVLNTKYIDAGKILEPKIFDYFKQKTLANLLPNQNLSILSFDAKDYNYNYFADSNYSFLVGVPDGLILEQDCILEIKTANSSKLNQPLDRSYLTQASLYAYLNNNDNYKLIVLYLEPGDYNAPNLVSIDTHMLKIFDFKVDKSLVEQQIQTIEKWYSKYTNTNISPKFDLTKDKDQIEYLLCNNEQEWIALLDKWKSTNKASKSIQP